MQPTPTIFRRLLLVVLAALVPLGAVIGYVLYRQFRSDHAEAVARLQVLTSANAEHLSHHIEDNRRILGLMAAEPAVREARAEACDRLFRRLITFNPHYSNVALLNAAGQVVAAANLRPINPQSTLVHMAPYREALDSGSLHISEPYVRAVTEEWTCLLSHPVDFTDGTRGAIVVPVNLHEFAELLSSNEATRGLSIMLVDVRSGTTVITLPETGIARGEPVAGFDSLLAALKTGRRDSVRLTGGDGQELTVDAVALDGTPWIICSALPTRLILQTAWSNFWRTLAGGGLCLLIAVVLSWRLTHGISRPIRALAAAARSQTPVAEPPGAPVEIADSLRAFNAMLVSRQQAKVTLAASEHRYRTVVEQTGQMVYDYDVANNRVAWFGRAAIEAITGSTPDELNRLGVKGWEALLHPDDRETAVARLQDCLRTGRSCHAEYRLRHRDGSYHRVEERGVVVPDLEGNHARMLGCMVDVTARHEAERVVAETKQQLQSIINTLDGIVWEVDTETMQFTFVSSQAERILGYPAERWITEKNFWTNHMHPEDLAWAPNYCVNETQQNRDHDFEYRMIAADGRTVWLHDVVSLARPPGRPPQLRGVMVDVTKRKKSEEENARLQAKLQETQRWEQIGLLAGGIAHDFNNLLTGILGHASLAQLALPAGSPGIESLDQIKTASRRAAELCRQMLAYAGKERLSVESVDLNALVRGTVQLLEVTVKKSARIESFLAGSLPAINADPTQLRQVVMNLVINAGEAIIGPDGLIRLTTGAATLTAADLADSLIEAAPGDYVWLEVADNGVGMDAGTMRQIFDPFFTTKSTGTGLGLSAILGIVRSHHGTLSVKSALGQGTTFRVFLPAAPGRTGAPEPPAEPKGDFDRPRQGRLLIIDDDQSVRMVLRSALARQGYQIDEAEDGVGGLELFKRDPAAYTAVILDLTMPYLSGQETLQRLRALRPDLRALLISGFNRQFDANGAALDGFTDFLPKPFDIATLTGALDQLLLDDAR